MAAKKSLFRSINDWFHLWVGIAVGIPVIIIAFTGCLLVYEQEIKQNILYASWWHIAPPAQSTPLTPSALYIQVKAQRPDKEYHRFWYYGDDMPVKISPDDSDSLMYVNPYTGKIIATLDHEDFFDLIEEGHTGLWMPPKIGGKVVSWVTLAFFILLITGLVLWLPKKWNKKTMKDSFRIRWDAKLKRINYDLHNVLGFYSLLLAVLISFTGLIMGFAFINKGVYKLAGGTPRERKEMKLPAADSSQLHQKVDTVWMKVRTQYARYNKTAISIHFPKKADAPVYTCTDMHNGSWRTINFDQNTLAPLPDTEPAIDDAATADWIMRSNYGLHVGAIYGGYTKILYFLASLICATLPVTGFYIWWGKKKKQRK